MITATSASPDYHTMFTEGIHTGESDASVQDGGLDIGFHPHDLLEAAIATCVNITLRMYAARHGMPLESVIVRVTLDKRTNPAEAIFRQELDLTGDLTDEQRAKLHTVAAACPVRRTLMRTIRFVE